MNRQITFRRVFPACCMAVLIGIYPSISFADDDGKTPKTTSGEKVKPKAEKRVPGRVAVRGSSVVKSVLNKRIEEIDWDETPLEAVFDWVAEQGEANVVVVWRALEAEGVDRDTPINLRLKNTTVGKLLSEALIQISEGDGLRYHASGNTIKVSTRRDFNRKLYVRVYDASDLIFKIPDFQGPSVDLAGQSSGGGGGGGGGGSGGGTLPNFGDDPPFDGQGGNDDDNNNDQDTDEEMEKLVEMIRNTIAPDEWSENGGKNTIRYWKKNIIVRASIEVHEQIGGPFVLPD